MCFHPFLNRYVFSSKITYANTFVQATSRRGRSLFFSYLGCCPPSLAQNARRRLASPTTIIHLHPLPRSKHETEGVFLLSAHPPSLKLRAEGFPSHRPHPLLAQNTRWRGCFFCQHTLPCSNCEQRGFPPINHHHLLPCSKCETEGCLLCWHTTTTPPSLNARRRGRYVLYVDKIIN